MASYSKVMVCCLSQVSGLEGKTVTPFSFIVNFKVFPFSVAVFIRILGASKNMLSTFFCKGINKCFTFPFTNFCSGTKLTSRDIFIISILCSRGRSPASCGWQTKSCDKRGKVAVKATSISSNLFILVVLKKSKNSKTTVRRKFCFLSP